jgi:hypothetical protein
MICPSINVGQKKRSRGMWVMSISSTIGTIRLGG